jgi:hypothetical protein
VANGETNNDSVNASNGSVVFLDARFEGSEGVASRVADCEGSGFGIEGNQHGEIVLLQVFEC